MQKANTNIERPYFICPAEQTGPHPLETFKPPWCCSFPRSPRDIPAISEGTSAFTAMTFQKSRWAYGSISMLHQASEFIQRPQAGLKHFHWFMHEPGLFIRHLGDQVQLKQLKDKTDNGGGALTSHWYLLLPTQASGRWNSDSCTRRCGAALWNEEKQGLSEGAVRTQNLFYLITHQFILCKLLWWFAVAFFSVQITKNSCTMKLGQPKFKRRENTVFQWMMCDIY